MLLPSTMRCSRLLIACIEEFVTDEKITCLDHQNAENSADDIHDGNK